MKKLLLTLSLSLSLSLVLLLIMSFYSSCKTKTVNSLEGLGGQYIGKSQDFYYYTNNWNESFTIIRIGDVEYGVTGKVNLKKEKPVFIYRSKDGRNLILQTHYATTSVNNLKDITNWKTRENIYPVEEEE